MTDVNRHVIVSGLNCKYDTRYDVCLTRTNFVFERLATGLIQPLKNQSGVYDHVHIQNFDTLVAAEARAPRLKNNIESAYMCANLSGIFFRPNCNGEIAIIIYKVAPYLECDQGDVHHLIPPTLLESCRKFVKIKILVYRQIVTNCLILIVVGLILLE